MKEVRSKVGVPVAADFGSHLGTPIVVDITPGSEAAYILNSAGSVVSVGGGSSSSSATWTEIEVDFGTTPVFDSTFLISDAGISGTSKVAVVPSGKAGMGLSGQGQDGGTMGANAFFTNNTLPTTALPVNTALTANLPTGLGGGRGLATLCSVKFDVPVVVHPGENVGLFCQIVNGAATATGGLFFIYDFDHYYQ